MMFSVIVPCYNSKDFIRKCISSILAQSYRDFEIVLIDDGSTDGTSEILDEYANLYDYVHVYHFPNSGVSYSRRRGITLANGNYLINTLFIGYLHLRKVFSLQFYFQLI